MNSPFLKNSRFLFALLFVSFTIRLVSAQVIINEVCPANVNGLINPTTGDYDDWIEVYNASSSPINLSGWMLSDDIAVPNKFTFPNTTLGSNQPTVVFTADYDKTSTIVKWSSVVDDSNWKIYTSSNATPPASNWRSPLFNASSWSSCTIPTSNSANGSIASMALRNIFTVNDTSKVLQGALYVDYDDSYVIYLNGTEIARNNVGTPGYYPLWTEPARESIGANIPSHSALDSIPLDIKLLRQLLLPSPAQNVLAMEVHNQLGSSDIYAAAYLYLGCTVTSGVFNSFNTNSHYWYNPPMHDFMSAKFKLSRSGEIVYLFDSAGILQDTFQYTSTESNNSWGRCSNTPGTNYLFQTPSPAASNGSLCYQGYAPIPILTLAAGFFPSSQTCTLIPDPNCTTRFTTNGNTPSTSSSIMPAAMSINQTVTIRARNFRSFYLPSPIVTNTYIIGEDIQLPVFTITTDSSNLWDWNTGIYATGPNASTVYPFKGANFWQDWKKPASMEFFEKGNLTNRLFNFDGEISIYGNYSQAKPQKSFEIQLSDRFGTSQLNYNFIPDKPQLDHTDDIVLRNSGTDWNKVHFRDGFMERVLKPTYSGYIAAEPTALYLNGEFWGVYTNHENHDENWQKYNYGLNTHEINYLKESGSTIDVKEGTDSLWWDIYNYATTNSPATQAFYNYLDARIDFQNYADYFIAETYVDNGDWIGDWTNNIKMWSPRKPGGKLKYLVYDLDFGFGYDSPVTDNRLSQAINPAAFCHSSQIFAAVTNNPTFRRYFINRYADLINTIFLPSKLDAVVASFHDVMEPDMPEQFQKWGSNMQEWESNISDMKNYYRGRPAEVRNQIESQFSMLNQVTLVLNVMPAGAGRILISTIIPENYPWNGVYFHGNPVDITAIPNPGYSFNRWDLASLGINTSQTATYDFATNQPITAYFTGSAQAPEIIISEINYNSSSTADCGDWVEVYNAGNFDVDLSAWELRDAIDYHRFVIPNGTVIHAGEYLVFAEDLDKFNALYQNVGTVLGPIGFNFSNSGDQIRLLDHRSTVIQSVYYLDIAPWPLASDGLGFTDENINLTGDPNLGTNWLPGCFGGSPGRAYSPTNFGIPLNVTGNTSICNGTSTQLTVSSAPGFSYQWFRGTTPISSATDSFCVVNQGGSYHVRVSYQGCVSESDTSVVTIVAQNAPPVAASTYRCGPGIATLIATAQDSVYWYTNASGGTPIAVGDTFTTAVLNSTVTYYAQTSLSCPSNRVPLNIQVLQRAADPLAINYTLCGPGAVTLTAVDTATIRWYNSAVGGGLLNIGSTFPIPFIDNDTAFYLEAGSVCPSNRVVLTVNFTETSVPTVSQNAQTCGPGPVVLIANCPDPVSWYDSPTGSGILSTQPTYITNVLTATDTFYVQSNGGCSSARVPVIAYVFPIPAMPIATDTTVCGNGMIDLVAASPEQIFWYDSISNGTLLHTGPLFTTDYLVGDTAVTYYLEAGDICKSEPRKAIQLNVVMQQTRDTLPLNVDCWAPVVLNGDTNAVAWHWSNGANTLSISTQFTDTINVTNFYANSCTVVQPYLVNCITGVEESSNQNYIAGIYPNPATDHVELVLQMNQSDQAQIEILDVAGRRVLETDHAVNYGINRVYLPFAKLSAGSYLVRVKLSGGLVQTNKLIIQ